MNEPTNYVREAIRSLGGITKAVVATGISESTWHRYRRMGRIDESLVCCFIAAKTQIPFEKLAGYTPGMAIALKPRGIRTGSRLRGRRRASKRNLTKRRVGSKAA